MCLYDGKKINDHLDFEYAKPLYVYLVSLDSKNIRFISIERKKINELESISKMKNKLLKKNSKHISLLIIFQNMLY